MPFFSHPVPPVCAYTAVSPISFMCGRDRLVGVPACLAMLSSYRANVGNGNGNGNGNDNGSGPPTWKPSASKRRTSARASRQPPTLLGCLATCCWRRRRGARPWSDTRRLTASARSWARSVTLLYFAFMGAFVENV